MLPEACTRSPRDCDGVWDTGVAQIGLESGQTREIPLPWANPQLEAARRLFLDRHPLAKIKEQARLASQV